MRDVSTFVLAGGVGKRLFPLTRDRSKPAVSFGGNWRLIDFTLSNCLHSGIGRAAVLAQYKSESLVSHASARWNGRGALTLDVLEPRVDDGIGWYRGTADSVYRYAWMLRRDRPRDVLILAGDHVYAMDYRPFVAWHRAHGAELTIAVARRPRTECSQFGIVERREDGRVTGFLEKPAADDPRLGAGEELCASMGIYVFRTDVLLEALADGPGCDRRFDFGADIIPRLVAAVPVQSYVFEHSPSGRNAYWRDVGTIDAYFEAHMAMLARVPPIATSSRLWPMLPASERTVSRRTVLGDGAWIEDSIVGPDCLIEGSVQHSVVSRGVEIAEGAEVRDAVVLPGARIGGHCRIAHAIVDEGSSLPAGTTVGYGDELQETVCSPGGVAVFSREDDVDVPCERRGDLAHAGGAYWQDCVLAHYSQGS